MEQASSAFWVQNTQHPSVAVALCTESPVSLPNVLGLICSLNCDIVKTVTKIFPSTILTAILTPHAETHTHTAHYGICYLQENRMPLNTQLTCRRPGCLL